MGKPPPSIWDVRRNKNIFQKAPTHPFKNDPFDALDNVVAFFKSNVPFLKSLQLYKFDFLALNIHYF